MEALTTQTESGLQVLDNRELSLRELADQFRGLTIAGIDDKEGYKKVHEARMVLKNERVQVKKDGEALRESAVKFQRRVIERVNDLTLIISPVEDALEAEEKRIDHEKEEIRKHKEMMEAKILQDRLTALNAYNFAADYLEVKHMSDDQFEELAAHAKNLYDAALKRQVEEAMIESNRRKEEEDRIQKEREELAKQRAEAEAMANELRLERERIENEQLVIRKEQEAKEAAIRAEREKFEEEKRKHEEEKRIEAARVEAAEQARIEEQNRLKRESEEKIERERLEKLEAERQEALKPDKDKLFAIAKLILSFPFPDSSHFNSKEAQEALRLVADRLVSVGEFCHDKAKQL
jgi:myosin heavy subunit